MWLTNNMVSISNLQQQSLTITRRLFLVSSSSSFSMMSSIVASSVDKPLASRSAISCLRRAILSSSLLRCSCSVSTINWSNTEEQWFCWIYLQVLNKIPGHRTEQVQTLVKIPSKEFEMIILSWSQLKVLSKYITYIYANINRSQRKKPALTR